MGKRRGGEGHIRRDAVRGTVPSVLCRAVLLLAAAIWVAPSCVHPAADHNGLSTGCPRRLTDTVASEPVASDTVATAEGPHEKPVTYPAPAHGPSDVSGSSSGTDTGTGTGSGSGSDDCVAGPRGGGPAPGAPPATPRGRARG
ncbi:hypothetical protein ACFWMG_03710, partial [Streptomyces sp. NPDC127074]